ncbi:hypothetical protein TH66_05940 [Carbonactinospora thermoautotrophica]|uniref:Alpha-L-rhamnosidase six-hairpin glycosidase domain-containing protein n=2 Tax=Carbonactinospora thermoautotrophica TaxID=1469144 RepID=A0A132N3W6_9ACTN|nr:hypothetical protein [Carbonactinospora thermoautotrophica]KWX04737.1 hypothetical protein TH66_05940 [Carbonactinospora thermoautotrophica]
MVDWRAAVLRRLARRFHIGEDVLRHLTTFQRLGERFEIEAPTEMLPVGARTLARALRTRAAAQIRPDWVWPYWLNRQLDPRSPAFVPRGHLPFTSNVTHRNWTGVGNPLSPWEAIVDPAGLVTVEPDSWSLDWWVCDGETWIVPSRGVHPRQSLPYPIPLVETAVTLADGGEVSQRVYAVETTAGERVVVQVRNGADRPVRVAFAIRPYNPEGLAVVEDIELTPERILIDGREAVLLPEPPEGTVFATFHTGDCLHRLRRGDFGRGGGQVHDPAGLAQAAVVYPVPPGGSRQVLLPLPPLSRRETTGVAVREPARTEQEALGRWTAALDRGLRVRLPDERLQRAVDANRAYLLLLHDPGSITAGPHTYHRFWFRDAAYQVAALDRWGFHAEAADVLVSYPNRQRHDGFFYSQWREWDANGAAIWAIAEHFRLTRDERLLAELAPAVRQGVNWIWNTRRAHRHQDPRVRGLLPPGVSAEHLGPFDYYYWDDFWALRGLYDGAMIARTLGHTASADVILHEARAFRHAILASINRSIADTGRRFIPAGPYRGVDAGLVGSLVACQPLELLEPDDPLVTGTLEVIRERFTLGDAFYQEISHTGLGTYLTLQLAFVELERRDPTAWRRLRWLLDAASPTFTWPEAIHPQLGGGCMGDGHHGWTVADFLSFVRAVLVREQRDGTVALLTLLPEEWRGHDLEVRDAPTYAGRLSYRLTWDGDKAVLQWEWHTGRARLVAPGLDPAWSSEEGAGEVSLLAR